MDIDERIQTLEEEFAQAKEEIQQLLLDIRTFLMEAQTPLPVTASWDEEHRRETK